MPRKFTSSLYFPFFKLTVSASHKETFDLILRQFPEACLKPRRFCTPKPVFIKMDYHRTKYSLLPRSRHDCFHGFTLFHNQFIEEKRLHLDAGPRTLRTVVDFQSDTISSLIATPLDLERDLLFDLIFFQPLKCLLESKNLFLFHASLVAKNRQGILLSGKSGSGKSAVSLALAGGGYRHLSDDEVILNSERSAVYSSAFPSFPKIKKGLFRVFPEFKNSAQGPSYKKDKILVDVTKVYPSGAQQKVLPAVLIFPRYSRFAKARIELLNKKQIFKNLIKEEFMYLKPSSYRARGERFNILASLLDQVRVYRLYYSDPYLRQIPSVVDSLFP